VRRNNHLERFVAVIFVIAMMPGYAFADSAALKTLEQKIEKARQQQSVLDRKNKSLMHETIRLRRKMIESARSAQEREAILGQLESQLSELERDARQRKNALKKRRGDLSGTMNALGRLSRTRPEILLFTPGKPIDNVRSAMLLRIAIPRVKERAVSLANEIESLNRVKRDIAGKVKRLRVNGDSLLKERGKLRAMLTKKRALQHRTEAQRKAVHQRMARLTKEARSLRDLVARLDAARAPSIRDEPDRTTPPPTGTPDSRKPAENGAALDRPQGLRSFPSRGPITTPVVGRLVGRFGDSTRFGNSLNGMQLEARLDAQVIAPFDGQVVFSGPFRNYGQILIIEHQGGYHTVLAGLSKIDAIVGQWLLAGEPVGVLASRNQGKPTLYIELRHNGQPINPAPWIVARTGRVRG
jgi:murein hydrolase activator